MAAIRTDAELQVEMGALAGGTTTALPEVQPVLQTVGTGDLMPATSGQVGTSPVAVTQAASETGLAPLAPVAPAADVGQVAGISQVTSGVEALGGAQAGVYEWLSD